MFWLGFFCGSLGEVDRGQERTRILSLVRLLSITSKVPCLYFTLGRSSVFDAHLFRVLVYTTIIAMHCGCQDLN